MILQRLFYYTYLVLKKYLIINVENSCVVSISVENYKKNYVQKAQ